MSKEKLSKRRRSPARRAPAGILGHDPLIALNQKRALRPPAMAKSIRCPLIVLVENREPVRVALKDVLEESGCDVLTVENASDALKIATSYDGPIDFLITRIVFTGINGGLLSHLFQRTHPETQALFLSGSKEEVLICDDTSNLNTRVLEQPVPVAVVAGTVGQMIAKLQRH